jgi:hypothetical protein
VRHAELRAIFAETVGPKIVSGADSVLRILVLYGSLPPAKRDDLLNRHLDGSSMPITPRRVANWDTLRALQKSGAGIGGDSASYLSLTKEPDSVDDLEQARSIMRKGQGESECAAISVPQGHYNRAIAQAARGVGTQLLFTNDAVLNKCAGGWLESDMIGRISISTQSVADDRGVLNLERAMPWLMLRP